MAGPRPPSLKLRALQWLAQREHSRSELRQRLLRLARAPGTKPEPADPDEAALAADALPPGPAAEVDTLLDWLEAHRYLSDSRFVESRVQVRAARFGNLRIETELRQHGVTLAPADRLTLRDTEFERAREIWRRKYGQPAADVAGRMRQMRFLVGRGFTPEVVRRVVKGVADADD